MPRAELKPNPENATPEELRVAMEAAPHKRSYVRLATVRALLLGYTRAQVCQIHDRSDRMVRLWIECFNRGGIDALITRARPGRPRKVKLERVRDLLLPVLENPAQAGQVHWTGVKIHGYLKEQLSLELGYRTAVRWLHELNFHLRVPQPWPERQNEEERKKFQEELRALCADPQVELWFGDESGFEGDPRPRRRWVQPGKPRTVPYLGDHIRQNVIGAVAPQSGALFSLIVDGVDTDVFQFFLDEMAKAVPKEGRRAASVHSGQRVVAQSGAAPVASFRAEVLAGVFARLQPNRAVVAAGEGGLVLGLHRPHFPRVDRATLRRPQKLHRPAGQNRFGLHHSEMIFGNHSRVQPVQSS